MVTRRSHCRGINFSVGLFMASFAHLLSYHNWPLASTALLCSGTQPDGSRDTLGRQRAALPQPRCAQGGDRLLHRLCCPPLLQRFCSHSLGDQD